MHIQFNNIEAEAYSIASNSGNFIVDGMGKAGDFLLRSKIFCLLSFGHVHTLVHEMGHALSYKILTGGDAIINLSTASCYGSTTFYGGTSLSNVKATLVDLAGPLVDILFSSALIVAIFVLSHFVPMSEGLRWGLRLAISIPAMIWIFGEFFYASVSAVDRDNGDFGKIIHRGPGHFLGSLSTLVTVAGLAALGIAFLL